MVGSHQDGRGGGGGGGGGGGAGSWSLCKLRSVTL